MAETIQGEWFKHPHVITCLDAKEPLPLPLP